MLSFFAFSQFHIRVGFLHFLYSGQFGTRSKTQSFRETALQLTYCSSFVSHGLLLRGTNPVILCTSSSEGRDGKTKKKKKKISISS